MELAVLARALRVGDMLHVLYGAGGPTDASRVAGTVAKALSATGFSSVSPRSSASGYGVSGVAGTAQPAT